MLKQLLHRPIGVFMTACSIAVVSIVFIRQVPVSLLPNIAIPRISIQMSRPGMDARNLENSVVRPIRTQMLQVNHLKDIQSRTRNGAATIELLLEYGSNTDLSLIEINEKLDQVMHLLPREMERPRIIKSNISNIPVCYVQISSKNAEQYSGVELSQFAQNILRRRLEQLDEISFADIHGLSLPELLVIPIQDKIAALQINEKQLTDAITQANMQLGNVSIRDGAYEYSVLLGKRLINEKDVADIRLNINGMLYRLGELAEIRMDEKQRRSGFILDGEEGISISIRKKADANNFLLLKNLNILITELQKSYPGIRFQISNNQSEILQSSIDSLSSSLLLGMLIAIGIMFLFFRDWRLPLLIGITVPISLILTLFCFYLFKVSINIISLSGLILGIGLMIDNAIIIIENIRQKRLEMSKTDATIEGTNEVIKPLISSSLTTISVFFPLILLSGLAGALFYDQALSITLALSCSLIVSYFLLPVFAFRIMKNNQAMKESKTDHQAVVNFILKHRLEFLLGFILLSLLIWPIYNRLEKSSFPEIARSDYEMHIDWNEAIRFDENEKRTKSIVEKYQEHCVETNAYVGEIQFALNPDEEQNINESKLVFYLDSLTQYEDLVNWQKELLSSYPSARIGLKELKNVFDRIFVQDEYPLYLRVQPVNRNALPDITSVNAMRSTLNNSGFVSAPIPMESYLRLVINHERLGIYHIDEGALIAKLNYAFRNNVIGELKSSEQFIPIQLTSYNGEQQINEIINTQYILNKNEKQIPLYELVKVERSEYFKYIESTESGESILFGIESFPKDFESELSKLMQQFPEMSYSMRGYIYDNQKLIEELQVIGLVVLLLLFLILAAQFESIIQPLIVALTLPVGILGALLALYLFGESLNVISLVGIIVMSGIDVNDAIVKIDMINLNVRKGMSLNEAIADGSERRFRAIIMTSLTTMLAVMPMLWSSGLGAELQKPMAIALIGGLIFGTISSLVMVPVFYRFFYRDKAVVK